MPSGTWPLDSATSVYSPSTTTCPRCNGAHELVQCPQVKCVEFDEFGRVKRVEFVVIQIAIAPPPLSFDYEVEIDLDDDIEEE